MPITLIEQNPQFEKKVEGSRKFKISEMFSGTLQGEGVSAGHLSTFVRLQGCTLKCIWCDTLEVWPNGNEYSFDEIFKMFEDNGLIESFRYNKQHLIFTGGSPLKQQNEILEFLKEFHDKYGYIPYVELENEGVLQVLPELTLYIKQYNNSPKLANSGMKERVRIKPDCLKQLNNLINSWFKFVVSKQEDWDEIERDFILPGYISKFKIILMPEGQTQEELAITRPITADIAIKHEVKFSDRMHITLWDKKVGV